jgi:hypothetical protein
MEAIRVFYLRTWRGLVLSLSLGIIAYLLYFSRLSSLPPGYSAPELHTYAVAGNWHTILGNPVNAPYKALVWICMELTHHSLLAARVVSACMGLLAAIVFFIVVRAWCSYRAALMTTILFAASAGLLHFARLGTGDILQVSVLVLLGVLLWYQDHHSYRIVTSYLLIALFALLWYVPGMVWFELLGLVLLRKTIGDQLRHAKTLNLVGMPIVFLLCITPLVWESIKHPRILEQIVGLPQQLHLITHVGTNLLRLVLGIVVHSNGNPLYWVGHAPLLSVTEVVALLLGIYYMTKERSGRTVFLLGSGAIGLVLASLDGGVTFACLLPVIYLCIATGIDRFLDTWLTVFPRNPVARIGGISIVCLMLAFSLLYQVRAYYVAWPHAPATYRTFTHQG